MRDLAEVAAHTPGHIHCPACDLARTRMIEPKELARLPFSEAAHIWLDAHRRHIGGKTILDYRNCIKALARFFSKLHLVNVHVGHFEEYQRMRSDGSGGLPKAGPSRVNHELNTLSQILARAALWAPIASYYKPLPMPRPSAGRVLTEEEERRLFQLATTRPRWKVAYLCSLITVNTTCGPNEIVKLKLQDVELEPSPATPYGAIRIREGAKNEHRDRMIPLNLTAHFALAELATRARELGADLPEHYLLPHRASIVGQPADPARHMSSWKKAWGNLRAAAGVPGLRMYDLRHHVITKLLEDENTSERTVIELAGHVSRKMLDTYSHIRMKKKLEGVMALERVTSGGKDPRQDPLQFPEKKLAVVMFEKKASEG